jgi:alpha-tubulin suppressor-like RCC1 family protein
VRKCCITLLDSVLSDYVDVVVMLMLLIRYYFTSIDWTQSKTSSPTVAPKVVFVAAGSGVAGSHSMCIDDSGVLYAWGYGKATGLGTIQAINRPSVVSLPRPSPNSLSEAERDSSTKPLRVRSVACGDGFTVCVTMCGKAYSWGQWAHGRLGLGPIPASEGRRGFRSRSNQAGTAKLAKYQMRPARILGIENAVDVSCGESHALCRLAHGHVLAWGQNSLGQLGVGPNRLGVLRDAFRPILIAQFGADPFSECLDPSGALNQEKVSAWRRLLPNETHFKYSEALGQHQKPRAKSVFCGAFHSIVIDESDCCWTWGARGSPCLGHGDSRLISKDWAAQINHVFSLSSTEVTTMVPFELMRWCLQWSMPRCVENLRGHHVRHVVGGDLSTAFLTREGRLFLCGSGPVVPTFDPPSLLLDGEGESDPKTALQKSASGDVEPEVRGILVSMPRTPSSSWMRELCTRTVKYIGGSGCRLFASLDEEITTRVLTAPLFRKLSSSREKLRHPGSDDSDNDHDEHTKDDVSVDSRYTDVSSKFNSLFEARGRADCLTIASGHLFLCHRALLAQRSNELRDIIFMESPTDGTEAVVQVLLPELHSDAARALFYFLYRDALPSWALPSPTLLNALVRCGRSLRMPRLSLLAERYAELLSGKSLSEDKLSLPAPELPPNTLCKDLGSMVGDPEYSDVRFIADGKTVSAHRFVLETRSEYFRNMFRSGMAEGNGTSHTIDVVVPGLTSSICLPFDQTGC